jgi:hypothetical protein
MYTDAHIRPLSDPESSDVLKKLEKLEILVKSQEQRIRALETRPQEGVELGDGDLSEQEKKIMGYIVVNPNVTKQDVVDHFKGEMARVPVFNTIDSLVRYGIIEDNLDTKNRQVHRLSLNNDSIFYSVLQELTQFDKTFRTLTRKIKQKGDEIYPSKPDDFKDYSEVMIQAHLVLDSMLESYTIRYTHVWPKKFHDRKDVLNKLLAIVFNRITRIREYLPTIPVENIEYLDDVLLVAKLQRTEELKKFVAMSDKYGLNKEMEPVLDSLWEINKEIQGYAYPEPRLFSWEFEYYKDDWRKLLALTRKHPDQTLSKKKWPMDGLLNKPIELLLK